MGIPVFILAFFLSAGTGSDSAGYTLKKDVYVHYSDNDTSFVFKGFFYTTVKSECLFDVLYEFKHLKHLLTRPDKFVLLKQGDNWYVARYIYDKLIYKNQTTYKRVLNREENAVTFELVSSDKTTFLPTLLSSSGHYKVIPQNGRYKVEYSITTHIESAATRALFMTMAKKESIAFLKRVKTYTEKTCTGRQSP